MNEEDIKDNIRKRYGNAARQAQKSGCGCQPKANESNCCGGPAASTDEVIALLKITDQFTNTMAEAYSTEEKAALPEGADLGLGCGVPTRYSKFKLGETVLDLGSGAGVDCFLAAREVGSSGMVIGVDMTPEMVAQARRNKLKLGAENVEFRLGEIEYLPVDNSIVDIVISNCVLNLVPDKLKAFAEIYRVLKSGGRMVVSDMMIYGTLPDAVRSDIEAWAGCIAGAPRVEEYLEYARNAGLTNVHIVKESPYEWGVGEDYQVVSCIVEAWKE